MGMDMDKIIVTTTIRVMVAAEEEEAIVRLAVMMVGEGIVAVVEGIVEEENEPR